MLTDFEERKRREMTDLWSKHFEEYKHGFEMFTSKLHQDAPAFVIGFNPGGDLHSSTLTDRMEQFTGPDPDYSRPPKVEDGKHYHPDGLPPYASDSNQPGRIKRYLFDGKQDLLKRTVETNRFYMRTSNKSEHHGFLQSLSGEAFEEYTRFCRETTRETIKRSNPDVIIDFANRYDGWATAFCADLCLDAELEDSHLHRDDGSVKGRVSIARLTDPPHSKVIAIKPHLSAVIPQEILDLFEDTIPPELPASSD